jgi:hypothetical protein
LSTPLESLNVGVSTNGGTSWQNVWQWVGFNPGPTQHTIDLSGSIAGEPNVMLQFKWDSGVLGGGDTWQIDNVQLEVFGGGPPPGDPPGPAGNPNPADGASGQSVDSDITWTAGSLAASRGVYFRHQRSADRWRFQGNQAGTATIPARSNTPTYFWRIDEVSSDGTTPGATGVSPPKSSRSKPCTWPAWPATRCRNPGAAGLLPSTSLSRTRAARPNPVSRLMGAGATALPAAPAA